MPSAYVTANSVRLLCHYQAATLYLGDHTEPREPELDAIARSGDYFVTLATRLETVAAELPETSTVASSVALSKLAQELEYMQRNYELVPKQASGPKASA